MPAVDLSTLSPEKMIDARGMACPGPLLEAKRAIPGVKIKSILEVTSSDIGTLEDIPLWCKKVGHDYLGNLEEAGYWRVFVRRGK